MDGIVGSPVRVTSPPTEAARVVQTGSVSGTGAAAIQGAISGQEQSLHGTWVACRGWFGTARGTLTMCAGCEGIIHGCRCGPTMGTACADANDDHASRTAAISIRTIPAPRVMSSSRHAADGRDQFLDLALLVDWISGGEGMRHAMRDMVAQHFALHLVERGADGADLGQDVHAVSVVFYHAQKAADLALDPPEAGGD